MTRKCTLGIDLGSVTVKFLLLDEKREIMFDSYLRTRGAPIQTLIGGLVEARKALPEDTEIGAVGTTGSGRQLAAAVAGADVVKNEITTHALGAQFWHPDIQSVIEIGGQDSKVIHLRDGDVVDFAMNSVCAAGTGAFLDQQAVRFQVPIEEFGDVALSAPQSVRIAGRCSVFAESDIIHKQQCGHDKSAIFLGLCQALVRNYLCNVVGGKPLQTPIAFQGGVSYNTAILKSFQDALPEHRITVPPRPTACGALGTALLAQTEIGNASTRFRGWTHDSYKVREDQCRGCVNQCELLQLMSDKKVIARWGGRCGRGNLTETDSTLQPECSA